MAASQKLCDQAAKGCWWMPWHQKAKKDAETCEKLRGAGRKHRSVGIRMGQPGKNNILSFITEYIGYESETCRSDTSQ